MSKASTKLKVVRWFDTVRGDIEKIDDAIKYFKEVVTTAEPHITAIGKLETLVAETPGLVYFYKGFLTDSGQIRKWLEVVYENEQAEKYKWFQTSSAAKAKYGELKVTDIKKFVDADEDLAEISTLIRIMANVEHQFDDICLGLQSRSIMLSHLVAIRKEGLEEVWIDPNKDDNSQ